jgi:ABC-type bacteriocin/lantibiotic exporter with double-glycine peptidase domain
MILDLLAGFIIICLLIAYFYVMSLAITFWFISIPLFILWFYWMLKREGERQKRRERNTTPEEKAREQRDLNLWRAQDDMFRQAKAREKARNRR